MTAVAGNMRVFVTALEDQIYVTAVAGNMRVFVTVL